MFPMIVADPLPLIPSGISLYAFMTDTDRDRGRFTVCSNVCSNTHDVWTNVTNRFLQMFKNDFKNVFTEHINLV